MNDIDRLFPVAAHAELVSKVIEADATRNASLFASLLTAEGTFRIGARPAVQGPASIEAAVAEFFRMLGGGIEHTFEGAWTSDRSLVWQAQVTWTLGDGRRISAPYVNVLRLAEDGRVEDYRVHVDMTVLAPPPPRA